MEVGEPEKHRLVAADAYPMVPPPPLTSPPVVANNFGTVGSKVKQQCSQFKLSKCSQFKRTKRRVREPASSLSYFRIFFVLSLARILMIRLQFGSLLTPRGSLLGQFVQQEVPSRTRVENTSKQLQASANTTCSLSINCEPYL